MYLKDMVTKKVKQLDVDTITLIMECNSVVLQKIAMKCKESGSFTLLIQIGDSPVVHALYNLGECINLMLLSMLNTLGVGKLRPCSVLLQMDDRKIVHLEGIIEDVLIKVDGKSEYWKSKLRNMKNINYGVPKPS
ncbi:uncharacterized protein LOC107868673 [Capsicum annuum]|uniref:uncharacterized protein LOC107868673 n=1 Tax=Capsicum annuum TaxID=4072 RepID=UPI0007BF5F30|nr:uncharacterized protein LOC107868673 [Capsicum annuum]